MFSLISFNGTEEADKDTILIQTQTNFICPTTQMEMKKSLKNNVWPHLGRKSHFSHDGMQQEGWNSSKAAEKRRPDAKNWL